MNTGPRVPATEGLKQIRFFGALLVYYGKITVLQNTIKYHICSYIHITNLAYFLFITHTLAGFCFQNHIHCIPVTHNSFAEENQVKLKSQHS